MNTSKKIGLCKDLEARLEAAKAAGFDFSVSEIDQVVSLLSEEELENITGGSWLSALDRFGGHVIRCILGASPG